MQANDAADDANAESREGDLDAGDRGREGGGREERRHGHYYFSLPPLDLHRGAAARQKGRSSPSPVSGRASSQSRAAPVG